MYTRSKFTSVPGGTPCSTTLSSVHTLQVYISTYPEAHPVPLLYLVYTRYKFTSLHQYIPGGTPCSTTLSSVHTLQVYISTYPDTPWCTHGTVPCSTTLSSVHTLQVYISTYLEAHPVPLLYLVYTRSKFTSVHTRRHTLFHYSI